MASRSELQRAVDALAKQEPGWKPFIKPAPQGAKPEAIGKGTPGGSAGKTGLDDLVEKDIALRQAYAPIEVPSSDGWFTIKIAPLKEMVFENGQRLKPKNPAA